MSSIVLLTVLFGLAIAAQAPAVQTFLARKVIDRFKDEINADITFDELLIRPFDAVSLTNVAIIDRNPYLGEDNPSKERLDTFARAKQITAIFSIKGLLHNEGLYVREITVEDGMMVLTTEPAGDGLSTTNIKRIFNGGNKPKVKKEPSDKTIFEADRAFIDGFRFRLRNFRNKKVVAEDAISWNDLDVRDIHLRARKLKFHGKVMEGIADELSFHEKSGYKVLHLSGNAKVGDGRTLIHDLRIRDLWSNIDIPKLHFNYIGNPKAYNDFINEIDIDAEIRNSKISFGSIAYFAQALKKMDFTAMVDTKVSGHVRDLTVKNFRFRSLGNGVGGTINGTLTGLPDSRNMILDYRLSKVSFTPSGLEDFIRGFAPNVNIGMDKFAADEDFVLDATAKGTLDGLAINADLEAVDCGRLYADVLMSNVLEKTIPISFRGKVHTDRLDIGRIARVKALGKTTLITKAEAVLVPGAPSIRIDSLRVDRLDALDYSYTGIAGAGLYSGKEFDGRLVCNDPNLNFIFQGIVSLSKKTNNALYKFYANLGHADLRALKLDRRGGASKLSLWTSANFTNTSDGNLLGNISVHDFILEDNAGIHKIGDIDISSHNSDNVNRIRLTSDLADASYVGSGMFGEFINDLKNITIRRELPALDTHHEEWSGNWYNLNLRTRDTRDLLAFLRPGLYIADNTVLNLGISREGLLDAHLTSQRLALGNKYMRDVDLKADNTIDNLTAHLVTSEIKLPPLRTDATDMLFFCEDNRVNLGFSYDNNHGSGNKGDVYIKGYLSRNDDNILCIDADLIPSKIFFNGSQWILSGKELNMTGKDITAGDVRFTNGEQSISLNGGYSPHKTDTLRLEMQRFDISLLNSIIGADMDLSGSATGWASLDSPVKDRFGLHLDMAIDSSAIAGAPIGSLKLRSVWDDSINSFRFLARNDIDGVRTLDATGSLSIADKSLKGSANLDGLDLTYLKPFLKSVFSDIGGTASGEVGFSGKLDDIRLTCDNLRLEDALLKVAFTGVPYIVRGPLSVKNNMLSFDSITIRDFNDARGSLSGGLSWKKNFTAPYLDTHVTFSDMQIIDIKEGGNPSFYGNAYGSGRVDITGPFNAIRLDIEAATSKDGEFHLPLNSSQSVKISDLLTFTEDTRNLHVDPYEEMMKGIDHKDKKTSDFSVHANITPHTGLQAFIEIDKSSGNVLSARGSGNINVDFRQLGDVFSLGGAYNIMDGLFHFSALGIASRNFTIQNGSSVKFNGDVMDTDLDIDAIYKAKASIGRLIADTTSVATRRAVDCGIHISDKLSNPRVSFSIDVPDLDPTTENLVRSALDTEDKIQKQFISLLVSGGFLPDTQSGIVNNDNLLASSVAEIMANQLGKILELLEIPVDVGLDYQQTSTGTNVFDVAVSTALFNNRVTVNGTIGNHLYNTETSNQEVAGDLDIDIKLDRPGNYRLNLFSHSADQYTNYLDNLQRNGVGITYQKEFDSFWEFLRNIFVSPKKRREKQLEKAAEAVPQKRIEIKAENE
ncbi:MAG: translocation/assembly module TamB domain-containing protein [Candidatus Cryptobacteroides sp.]|nr:translocation/assembly module TamB domain-containing protein [Candidatus Cryptobacteroides sp.]